MDLTVNDDGSITITWDENDPLESELNDWDEEQFIAALEDLFDKATDEWENDDEL